MDSKTIINELQQLFERHFDMEDVVLSPETTSCDIRGWDSFAHVTLLGDIEGKFNINFSGFEIANFKTVGDIINSIAQKLC